MSPRLLLVSDEEIWIMFDQVFIIEIYKKGDFFDLYALKLAECQTFLKSEIYHFFVVLYI